MKKIKKYIIIFKGNNDLTALTFKIKVHNEKIFFK